MSTARVVDVEHGLMFDLSDSQYPSAVFGLCGCGRRLSVDTSGTIYGYLLRGGCEFAVDDRVERVAEGRYFSFPFTRHMEATDSAVGFFVLRIGYFGLSCIGGPLEPRGRLKYIDGCSDTLLISPVIKGDPCFNLLHFPPGIDQTKHTHPSVRVGLIHDGRGLCHTDSGSEPLIAGKMFVLFPGAVHGFSTMGTDGMCLTVYHPDTDFGPSHNDHPMLNRTIVDGISARNIDAIQTKSIE